MLWAGGTILTHPDCRWRIVTLCRAGDPDRAPKFRRVLGRLGAEGAMGDLDDGPAQEPLEPERVRGAVLDLLGAADFDLVLTHGPRGEYTRHRRHEEAARAVVDLWESGSLRTGALWMFAYEDGGGAHLPRPAAGAARALHAAGGGLAAEARNHNGPVRLQFRQLRGTHHAARGGVLLLPLGAPGAGVAREGGSAMKVLVLYDYPPSPGGLATQGDLLYRGLVHLGVETYPVHFESPQEKEWYYRWFAPDVVVGIGYWGHTPHLVLHPQRYGAQPVPWLVADGYLANYHEVLNALPLILVTSNWVKDIYVRDGLDPANIEVLPVGCDTDAFMPRPMDEPKVATVREALGVSPDQILVLTVGGDAASKGAQEVMQALAIIDTKAPDWKYVCKVWPQPRTFQQNLLDLQLATHLGIDRNVVYTTGVVSRNFMPYLMNACDIYAGPSRLEGFGMPHVEASASGKPVLGINAMGCVDTQVHGQTAYLAGIGQEIRIGETVLGQESGYEEGHRIVFEQPRTADYRASVHDIANYLFELMEDPALRARMGQAGRRRAVERFDYRVVAQRLVDLLSQRLGIS